MTAHIVVFILFAVGQYLLQTRTKETEWQKSPMYVALVFAIVIAFFYDKSDSIFGKFIVVYYFGTILIAAILGMAFGWFIYRVLWNH